MERPATLLHIQCSAEKSSKKKIAGAGHISRSTPLTLFELQCNRNRRFGSLSPELQKRLRGLTLEQLEELSEVLLDFTAIAQLETWLQNQES